MFEVPTTRCVPEHVPISVAVGFLSEQKSNLAPKTYRDYASVIDLFANQLDGYAWNNLDNGDKAYDKAQKKGKSFIDLYDHTHIEENVGEFLDYFVPRKVIAGDDFILKTCPRVIRKLLKWMREKHLVDVTNEDIQAMCENQLWEDTMRDMGF